MFSKHPPFLWNKPSHLICNLSVFYYFYAINKTVTTMIYRFTIISDEVDDFVREIQIDPEATFFDLHEAILKAANYTNDQMTSFFICDDDWEKEKEITLEESFEIYLMRANYETMAVKLMGGNVPEDTICRMEEVLEKMKKLDEEQFDQVFVYDNQMHGLLVEMTGMIRLYKAWKELNYGNIVTGFSLSTDKKRVVERQYPIHKELVDACREKNKEKICHVLSDHYMRTIRRLLKEQGLSEEDSGFSFDFLV